MKQHYNISIYCNIYYSNTIQYSLKETSIYCTLQYNIVIYCNVCCLNVVNAQSLHHKNNWTSIVSNLDYMYVHLGFLHFYTVMQDVHSFFTAKTHIPI